MKFLVFFFLLAMGSLGGCKEQGKSAPVVDLSERHVNAICEELISQREDFDFDRCHTVVTEFYNNCLESETVECLQNKMFEIFGKEGRESVAAMKTVLAPHLLKILELRESGQNSASRIFSENNIRPSNNDNNFEQRLHQEDISGLTYPDTRPIESLTIQKRGRSLLNNDRGDRLIYAMVCNKIRDATSEVDFGDCQRVLAERNQNCDNDLGCFRDALTELYGSDASNIAIEYLSTRHSVRNRMNDNMRSKKAKRSTGTSGAENDNISERFGDLEKLLEMRRERDGK